MSLLIRFWPALAGVLVVLAVILWHKGEVSDAYKAGAVEQAAKDRQAVEAAEKAATAAQTALIDATRQKSADISKGTDNALQKRNADLARSYDDLRLRWEAYRADQGRAGQDGATALASAAGVPDDAYCPSQGWVSLDVAAAAAEAADTAIAKDDAWREWWLKQSEAWPE